MKSISYIICLCTGLFFLTSNASFALPICPGSPVVERFTSIRADVKNWHNCIGSYEWKGFYINGPRSEKYIGEFQNGLEHGYGKYIDGRWPDKPRTGYWVKGYFNSKLKPLVETTTPVLKIKTEFVKFSESDRKQIQSILKRINFYSSKIDGLYGKSTLNALIKFNRKYLSSSDLTVSENVVKLVKAVLNHEAISVPKIAVIPKSEVKPQVPLIEPKVKPGTTQKVASGTGFYVSYEGHIITNHHVIDGCQEMRVHSKGKVFETVKIASDAQNDLALLKIQGTPPHVFALSKKDSFPLQDIIVAGFPFGNRVSSTLKFTKGIVSSVAGIGNNYSEIQIDAALQPGNSGGPIIDDYGNVIAVAVSKLDMKKILKDYGVIPENTNFGVKASAVKNLMQGNGVVFKEPKLEVISKAELSSSVTNGTVYLTCWMTTAQIQKLKKRKVMFSEFEK